MSARGAPRGSASTSMPGAPALDRDAADVRPAIARRMRGRARHDSGAELRSDAHAGFA